MNKKQIQRKLNDKAQPKDNSNNLFCFSLRVGINVASKYVPQTGLSRIAYIPFWIIIFSLISILFAKQNKPLSATIEKTIKNENIRTLY